MDQHDRNQAPRIMLHSHDSFGLGHLRRTLTIASALTREYPGANVLVTTGSPCATHFEVPAGVEVIKLPSVTKGIAGEHVPRGLASIGLVDRLRRNLLMEVLDSFRPQLLIADHQPVGLRGELMDVLIECKRRGVRTVLGMRDIIDAPEVVAKEWNTPENRRALDGLYDRVCVYGAPEVFDPRVHYPLPPELAARVEFVGYVVRESGGRAPSPNLRPQVLVTMGGGEDGEGRVDAYLEALSGRQVPWDSTIVLGPLMPKARARHIKRSARRLPSVRVRSFYSDLPRLLAESDAALAMAGYNTVAELLATRTRSVLLPRTEPRLEQRIRARRLAELGLAQCLETLDPTALRQAVGRALSAELAWERTPALDGARRLAGVVGELLGTRTPGPRVLAQ